MKYLFVVLAFFGITFAQMDHSGMDMGTMDMQTMSVLEGLSGQDFDIAYMSQMIVHYQDAVNMSQLCLENANQAELKAFCQGVIDTQTQEIAQYQTWLKQLF